MSGNKRGRCGSAEGGYRPPPCWYPPEPRAVLDLADALKVNAVWQGLPDREKWMVKYAMVWREHWRATCRKLGIGHERYDEVLETSLAMMRRAL
jgi:hypothetical protein